MVHREAQSSENQRTEGVSDAFAADAVDSGDVVAHSEGSPAAVALGFHSEGVSEVGSCSNCSGTEDEALEVAAKKAEAEGEAVFYRPDFRSYKETADLPSAAACVIHSGGQTDEDEYAEAVEEEDQCCAKGDGSGALKAD
jgi:hypothetical protein